MAKLNNEQIQEEVENKGFKLVNADGYSNLESTITVQCSKGHLIDTNLKSIRHPSFECPFCASQDFIMEKPRGVPAKSGYRIIAFDQATEKVGMSIYDNGKLVYFDLFHFTDQILTYRLKKIMRLLEEVVIPIWEPDLLVFEDIQQQGPNVLTFKVLSMLLGICETVAAKYEIECLTVTVNTWRSAMGVVGAGVARNKQKKLAMTKVKELTGFDVAEDTAEAILIGKYAASKRKAKTLF